MAKDKRSDAGEHNAAPRETANAGDKDSARNNPQAEGAAADPAPLGMEPSADNPPTEPRKSKDSAQEKYGPTPAGGKVDPLLPAEEAPANAVIVECPYCGERCAANGGDAYFTRYYCPTKGCTFSHKLPKSGLARRLKRDRAREESDKGFSARP